MYIDSLVRDDIHSICDEELTWMDLKNKRVLIIGARGGMPSYIILTLLNLNKKFDLGIHIFAMCRNKKKSGDYFCEISDDIHFELVIHDVCDPFDDMDIAADVIIYAANVNGIFSSMLHTTPCSIYESNVIGFHHAIKAAEKWKSEKLILFSSGAVYGSETGKEKDESSRGRIDFDNIGNIYRISKQMMESMAYAFYEQSSTDIRVIRPFNVYGPLMGGASKGNHMTDFIRDYISEKEIIINGNGSSQRAYLYIRDAISAIFRIWLCGDSAPYNISGSHVAAIRAFAGIVAAYGGKNIPVRILGKSEGNPAAVGVYAGSDERIEKLGWEEKCSLGDGVANTIEWAKNGDFMLR